MTSITDFIKKNSIHFAALLIFFVITAIYCSVQLKGFGLKQHDIKEYIGMSHESTVERELTGEEPLWSNGAFGGMPTVQTSMIHEGNIFGRATANFLRVFPSPMGIILLYMIGFYIMTQLMQLNKWTGIIGAICFAFMSYQIIILQAGHNSKGVAIAFMAPVVGAFYYAFRKNWKWGILWSAVFLSFQMGANHLQVTYYMAIVLFGMGVVELYRAVVSKKIVDFLKISLGVMAAYVCAVIINYSNIALTNDYAKHTIRGGNELTIAPDGTSNSSDVTKGLDRSYVTQYSYGIGESFTLLSPYVKGGGTMALADSPFRSNVENSSLSLDAKNELLSNNAYWGNQPIVSGPVYLGVILVFLALLGMYYIKDKVKWVLLGATILTLMLSWGKNFQGMTDFFLDHVPGYDKFRAVTIILVIVELCIPVIAVFFVNQLLKEREQIRENIKPFYIISGVFVAFLFLLKLNGIEKSYLSDQESDPSIFVRQEQSIRSQIAQMSPEQAAQQGIDKNNPAQINEIIASQKANVEASFQGLKEVRMGIFQQSMNRSLLFVVLAIVCIYLFVKTSLSQVISLGALGIIAIVDVVTVSTNYLNNEAEGNGYKYWSESLETAYPLSPEKGDLDILAFETAANPAVRDAVAKGRAYGEKKALELNASGLAKDRIVNSYEFAALSSATNYRVFDLSGGFSSARASYFHKSIGGYHGAKLTTIQNMAEFHINNSNNKVFDMLNIKYFLQPDQQGGLVARPNPTALGNAWMVSSVRPVATPNDEIRALGAVFSLTKKGPGKMYINGSEKNAASIYGTEKLIYVPENSSDSIPITVSNGIPPNVDVAFVQDINGKTNLMMEEGVKNDTTNSFKILATIKIEKEFKPQEEAIMLRSNYDQLKNKKFDKNGTVKLVKYKSNELTYKVQAKGNSFVVFSEIYYPEGWTATIDGKEVPILKTDYLLRGLEVGKGNHTIKFSFDLPKYHSLNTLALIFSLLILGAFVVLIFMNRKQERTNVQVS